LQTGHLPTPPCSRSPPPQGPDPLGLLNRTYGYVKRLLERS
jgi:hypothetical protein